MSLSAEIVSRDEWRRRRLALLNAEKELTRERDRIAALRREMPWVRVEKDYAFEGPDGVKKLAGLFGPHSQLLVYHFMFAPEWERGCKSCSMWADGFDRQAPHLAARDIAFAAISRAPYAKLAAFKEKLGWQFPWYSCGPDGFARDFGVEFTAGDKSAEYNFVPKPAGAKDMTDLPGVSVFAKLQDGAIFHTYSCYARGIEQINPTYGLIDLVPKGRDEAGLPFDMAWVKLRTEYDAAI